MHAQQLVRLVAVDHAVRLLVPVQPFSGFSYGRSASGRTSRRLIGRMARSAATGAPISDVRRPDHSERPSTPVVTWRATAIGGLQFVRAPIELVCQLIQPPAGLVMGQARCKPADMAGAFTETDKVVSGAATFPALANPELFRAVEYTPSPPFSWRAARSDVLVLARSSADLISHSPHEGPRTR